MYVCHLCFSCVKYCNFCLLHGCQRNGPILIQPETPTHDLALKATSLQYLEMICWGEGGPFKWKEQAARR